MSPYSTGARVTNDRLLRPARSDIFGPPLLDALAGPRPYSIAHVSAATHFPHGLVVAQLLTEWAPFAAFTPKFLLSEKPISGNPEMGFLRLGVFF